MRHRVSLLMAFGCAMILGLIAFLPLSMAAKASGLAKHHIGWQQARGTVWNGELTGLRGNDKSIGALSIRTAKPWHIFRGEPHEIDWISDFGRARARARISTGSIRLAEMYGQISTRNLPGLDTRLMNVDGVVSLSNAKIVFDASGCTKAQGDISTDIVRQIGVTFDRDWPELPGAIGCTDGRVTATLDGIAGDQTGFRIVADTSGVFEMIVSNAPVDLRAGLVAAGFTARDGKFVLVNSVIAGGVHDD